MAQIPLCFAGTKAFQSLLSAPSRSVWKCAKLFFLFFLQETKDFYVARLYCFNWLAYFQEEIWCWVYKLVSLQKLISPHGEIQQCILKCYDTHWPSKPQSGFVFPFQSCFLLGHILRLLHVLTAAVLWRSPQELVFCSVPGQVWRKSLIPESCAFRAVSTSQLGGPHQHCLSWLTHCRKYLCRVNSSWDGPSPALIEAGELLTFS